MGHAVDNLNNKKNTGKISKKKMLALQNHTLYPLNISNTETKYFYKYKIYDYNPFLYALHRLTFQSTCCISHTI